MKSPELAPLDSTGERLISSAASIYRWGGRALELGAATFVLYVVLRSLMTAGVATTTFATQPLWVPLNALGLAGALLVLLGLPALYAAAAESLGRVGLLGIVLFAVAWLFFGIFLSLYGMLVLPWLVGHAPALVSENAAPPTGVVAAFVVGLAFWFVGALLLALPFIRGRANPAWVGYLMIASGTWGWIGNLLIAPNAPANSLLLNVVSNLAPVLALVAIGYLGFATARGKA